MMLKIVLMFMLTEKLPSISPLPHQIWNGDEIGCESDGDLVAVFRQPAGRRGFIIASQENDHRFGHCLAYSAQTIFTSYL